MKTRKKYKLSTWKLSIEGEYYNEKTAIRSLSNKYMKCSKCDAPGDHFIELMAGNSSRTIDTIAKRVYFYVYEDVYGHMQWILKYTLNIYPFQKSHWWPCEDFNFEPRKFKYEFVKEKEQS